MIDPGPMRRAIALAAPEHPHPNPRVGAVVLDRKGEVVGEGAHRRPGEPHAEVSALRDAGTRARGGTLYVTLEPCLHQGRTPPCVDAVIASGVVTVVVGAVDPDRRVAGRGVDRLVEAGLHVVSGFLGDEAEAVDPGYFHHRTTGMPLVTLKLAMTLDGSIAAGDGSSQWITSEEARRDAHLLRAVSDAVVIGAGTLAGDDPELTVRGQPGVRHQPVPVVIAGAHPLETERRLWERKPLVVSSVEIDIPSGELVLVPGRDGRPDPVATASALAERGLLDVLLEGGSTLAGAWWRAGVVSRGVLYLGARVGGGQGLPPLGGRFSAMAESRPVNIEEVRMVGPDVRIDFR